MLLKQTNGLICRKDKSVLLSRCEMPHLWSRYRCISVFYIATTENLVYDSSTSLCWGKCEQYTAEIERLWVLWITLNFLLKETDLLKNFWRDFLPASAHLNHYSATTFQFLFLCSLGMFFFLCDVSCMLLHISHMLILVRGSIYCCHKWGQKLYLGFVSHCWEEMQLPQSVPSLRLLLEPNLNHNPVSPGPWDSFCIGTSAWELALQVPTWPRGADLPSWTSPWLRALLCQEPIRGLQVAWGFWCVMLGKSDLVGRE